MIRQARFALALALALVAAGCGGSDTTDPQPLHDRLGVWIPDPGATLLKSAQSSFQAPRHLLVEDRATWETLWAESWGGADKAPPLPQMDFVLASVVVVGTGKRAGPGISITIDSIVTFTAGAVAYATDLQPDARCEALSGTSSPVHMAFMTGHPPVKDWRVSMAVQSCP